MRQRNKTFLALIIGFVIGFGSSWLWVNNPQSDVNKNNDNDSQELVEPDPETIGNPDDDGRKIIEEDNPLVDEEVVFVKDQNAGSEVFVSRVELKTSGWVVIHDDAGGSPGNILGAQRFDSGTFQGSVSLLRTTIAEQKYHATLWKDDGDKIFSTDLDSLITDATVTMFEAY